MTIGSSTTLFICSALALIIQFSDCGRVLVYSPSISFSHLISNGRIADALAEAGHEVVMFIPEYMPATNHFTGVKKAKVFRMSNISDAMENELVGAEEYTWNVGYSFADRLGFERTCVKMCTELMKRREELEFLREYNFDAAFAEQIDFCGIGVVRYLGIKNLLWVSTTPIMDAVSYNLGIPAPVSYVPTIEENDNGDSMSFFDRAYNLYMYFGAIYIHRKATDMTTEVFRQYVPDFPNVREVAANASLCFVNSDEMFDLPRPISHKIVYVGGLGVKDPKPLDKQFTEIMSKGKKGVIVFSLGTIAPFHAMDEKAKEAVVALVRTKPDYHFVVKINSEDDTSAALFSGLVNVDLVEWMPQSDLLAHERLRLFIMHGGVNGLTEAMLRSTPVIVIPVFADQFRNGRNCEKRGVGKVILKKELRTEKLISTVNTILADASFKKNALRMTKLMKSKPFTPEERLVKWTSFAIEQGELDVLHLEGSRMNSFVYFNLDVFAVVLLVLYLVYSLIAKTLSTIVRCFAPGEPKKQKKQ